MKTFIKVKLQVQGLHNWPDAEKYDTQIQYLSLLHRHVFHFEVHKQVHHDDRDIEIIMFKNQIIKYITDYYFDKQYNMCNFKNQSCEMLSKQILQHFDCDYVECTEDNENGAYVTK